LAGRLSLACDGISFSDDFRREVTVSYQDPGQYRITLQVKDNKGKTSETAASVFVKDNPGVCNQIYDMSPFLRQTSLSPRNQLRGEFDSDRVSSNLTAVKKGCFSAYSVDMKAGENVHIDIEVKDGLEGKVVDVLAFDVPNFLVYKDKNLPTLPPIIAECFKRELRGAFSCDYLAPRSGTLYIVIDNKDLPVLTPTEGPVQYNVKAVMVWPAVSPIPVEYIPVLVIAAIAAVGIAGFIFYLGRRAEKNY